MHRIGVSIFSAHDRSTVLASYVKPVRKSMMDKRIGFWANHLVEGRGSSIDPTANPLRNHLLMFDVFDFKRGVNFLRESFSGLQCPPSTAFIDLTSGELLY